MKGDGRDVLKNNIIFIYISAFFDAAVLSRTRDRERCRKKGTEKEQEDIDDDDKNEEGRGRGRSCPSVRGQQ